ncbi:IQ-DOMAIN 31-like protein [Tanacetum coccineum]
MGKVTRWFRGVLGMKKDKVNIDNSNAKTKKRWIFGKCMKDLSQRVTVENDSTRMRSCMSASEKKQNKHAIVVAATTIAVAGAQAALAVVRLTSDGKDTLFTGREKWAAIKIQSVYRGHLGVDLLKIRDVIWPLNLRKFQFRSFDLQKSLIQMSDNLIGKRERGAIEKPSEGILYLVAGKNRLPPRFSPSIEVTWAMRALKRIVKLKSFFRGFLVRKRVAATLYSMQALLRAQLAVRSKRAELAVRYQLAVQPKIRHGESTEILLKMNLPDHRSVLTDPEDQAKMEMETPRSSGVNSPPNAHT